MTFARDAPDSAAYFATYEYCKKKLTPRKEDGAEGSSSLLAVIVAGTSADIVILILYIPDRDSQESMASRRRQVKNKQHDQIRM